MLDVGRHHVIEMCYLDLGIFLFTDVLLFTFIKAFYTVCPESTQLHVPFFRIVCVAHLEIVRMNGEKGSLDKKNCLKHIVTVFFFFDKGLILPAVECTYVHLLKYCT